MSERRNPRDDGGLPGAGRWQDWLALVIGAVTALSPLWVSSSPRSGWSMAALGILIAAAALWSLARPGSTTSEYAHVALGTLLFLAPWVMRYTDHPGASWTSWTAGVLAVMAGLGALPGAAGAHRVLGQH